MPAEAPAVELRETLQRQIEALREQYAGQSVAMPCRDIVWAPLDRVVANDYNPNEVDADMMRYLTLSIMEDGLTQAPVAWYDGRNDQYVIVDGFHRFKLLRDYFKCNYIPLALVDLPRAARIRATVLHNRARGKHEVALTGQLVGQLRGLGWSNVQIAKHLAMPAEEILRTQQAKGMAQYYAHRHYSRAWVWHDSGQRLYVKQNVLEALDERLDYIFDRYQTIVISVSGGKDSTLLFEVAYKKAVQRGRKLHCFFLDQEAEYQSTIDVIRDIMGREHVIPHWFQVPCYMTNATSYEEDLLYAWGPGEEWMREKDPLAIHEIEGEYPQRFYPFMEWFERQWGPDACSLVGLRAEESLNRYRAVIKNPGVDGILWSTAAQKGGVVKFYPIYDWSFDDVFYHFYHNDVAYNRIYDWMHTQDEAEQITKYRVSNLIHEKAYGSLVKLQEFEPETYERMIRRLKGTRTAARYAGESMVYSANERPGRFASWREYRDHLLATMPENGRRPTFEKRFARQPQDETTYKHQCRQLLLGDWENNLPLPARDENQVDWRQKWMEIL